MLGAKAANIAGLALVTAVPAVAGCLIAGRLLLPAAGLNPAHGYALVSIAQGRRYALPSAASCTSG